MNSEKKEIYIIAVVAIFLIILAANFLNSFEKENNNTTDEALSQNNYSTTSPLVEEESSTFSPSYLQEDNQNSPYPEVSYKDIESGKHDESYVIITGILDSFKYNKILRKESCSFDLWIKKGNSYFKDSYYVSDCNESNLTTLKNAKSGNKVKLCVYVEESYISFSNGSIIGGGVVDNKDHRKNIKKNIIKNCKAISYKNLLRRPEKYVDKLVKVSGKILQIAEEDDTETEFLLTDDDGNTYYVNYKFPKSNYRLLEDDKISVYGASDYTYTYKNVLGYKKEVPELNAYFIK